MARSIEDIYNEIVTEKDNQNSLSGLAPQSDNYDDLLTNINSNSKVAVWRLWAYVTAVAIHTHEVLWDVFKSEVEEIAAAAPAGTPRWYQSQILAFQYGDSLVYQNDKYQYATINEAAKIVTRCAIQERSDGVVLVKVAKGDTGSLAPLIQAENDALLSYAQKIKFAGTKIAIVSLEGDVINLNFEVFYDPIEPLADVQTAVQSAVESYLQNLTFNGQFRLIKCVDVIQEVEGVTDVKINAATATPSGQNAVTFDRVYLPLAGYMSLADTVENMFTWITEL